MEIIGYVASLFIGVSLGLVGAGGSILTVPVMVYLFHVPVLIATSYSLFIVGITSLMGSCFQLKGDNVNGKVAVLFSLVSLTIVFFIRHYMMPLIPSQLFQVHGVPVSSSLISMLLFSLLMVTSARAMIRQKQSEEAQPCADRAIPRLLMCGVFVGLVTGFLGAGGGFILIPSLVLLLRLPMKTAIGTSLLIIALNSLVGFTQDIHHFNMDWKLLAFVTAIATSGVFIGLAVGKKLSAKKLKVSFGWLVMVVGLVIFTKEVVAFVTKI